MKQKKKSGKNPTQHSVYSAKAKNQDSPTRFHFSLHSAQISKNKKIHSILIIHEGKNGKNHKKEVKREVKRVKKITNEGAFSHSAKFSQVRNFRILLRSCSIFQLFMLFFPSGF